MIITQGADVAGGAGCFHGVTTDKAGVRTTVWTTSGHFRVNGLEVDTLAASEAKLEWKRKKSGGKETLSLKLVAPKAQGRGHGEEDRLHVPRGLDRLGPGGHHDQRASSSIRAPASAACR